MKKVLIKWWKLLIVDVVSIGIVVNNVRVMMIVVSDGLLIGFNNFLIWRFV